MGISLGGNDRLTRLEGAERTWIDKENNIYLTNSCVKKVEAYIIKHKSVSKILQSNYLQTATEII